MDQHNMKAEKSKNTSKINEKLHIDDIGNKYD